jgi:tol-pal system protein YbgF
VTIPAPSATAVGPSVAPGVPADQPLDLSALAKGGGVIDGTPLPQAQQVPSVPVDQKAVASIAPSGDPQVDYKKAYEFFVAGQYAASESAFRQFLTAYPSDDRASDATYWLGQTLYSRGMYREAALEFVNGHKLYPKSLRAADTMLLLGKSLAGIPERDAACQTFAAALKQYPQMAPSLKSRVTSEQANAGC